MTTECDRVRRIEALCYSQLIWSGSEELVEYQDLRLSDNQASGDHALFMWMGVTHGSTCQVPRGSRKTDTVIENSSREWKYDLWPCPIQDVRQSS
jgi:hypothetical protein